MKCSDDLRTFHDVDSPQTQSQLPVILLRCVLRINIKFISIGKVVIYQLSIRFEEIAPLKGSIVAKEYCLRRH